MSKKNFYYAVLVVGITAALSIAVTVKLSLSRAVPPLSPAPDSLLARATTVDESPGAQKEGIKVHGHWTIDVRNPDGSLVTHREFENGLVAPQVIACVLARACLSGSWNIELDTSGVFRNGWAKIYEVGNTPMDSAPNSTESREVFATLTVNANSALVLVGTATARTDGLIGSVKTSHGWCDPTVQGRTLNQCGSFLGDGWDNLRGARVETFTATDLSTPINVVAKQIIQVTVVISFS